MSAVSEELVWFLSVLSIAMLALIAGFWPSIASSSFGIAVVDHCQFAYRYLIDDRWLPIVDLLTTWTTDLFHDFVASLTYSVPSMVAVL
jgi:hypothetical protein